MNNQENARNYLLFATWLNLTKVAEQSDIKPKTLSNFVNGIKSNPRYPDSNPRKLTSGDFEKLIKWLVEFTNFTI